MNSGLISVNAICLNLKQEHIVSVEPMVYSTVPPTHPPPMATKVDFAPKMFRCGDKERE